MSEKLAHVYETLSSRQQQELLDFAYFLATKSQTPQTLPQSHFGGLRDQIKFVAPDFDTPIADLKEYM